MKVDEIGLEDAESEKISPPRKKLKQVRLPFQVLSPDVGLAELIPPAKRKLSEGAEDIKSPKVMKNGLSHSATEIKENICLDTRKMSEPQKVPDEISAIKSASVTGNETSNCNDVVVLDDSDEDTEQSDSNNTTNNGDFKQSNLCERKPGIKELQEKSSSKDVLGSPSESDKPTDLITNTDSSGSSGSLEAVSDRNKNASNQVDHIDSNEEQIGKEKGETDNASENMISNDTTKPLRKLTPKQLQKKLESSKRKEERQNMLMEKKKLKQEQDELKKKEKEKTRLEKEELRKNEKEKLRQEKEDLKKKEKEEKERKRQAEIDMRNEEKKAKEEEKRKKELLEEEAKRKKDKTVAAFTSFFVNKKVETKVPCELEPKTIENKNFMPFEVKGDMRLAPLGRSKLVDKEFLDLSLQNQNSEMLYLSELKNNCRRVKTSTRTWPLSDLRDDVVILDNPGKMSDSESENIILESKSDGSKKLRAKLMQFHENRRPPFWGTWRKRSQNVRPKCPFRKDQKFFDYEIDSDDEWEEEEPGESLHGSDDEKESVDDYEIDNDFFVPHGYLSDEENEGQEEKLSPETHKAKLELMELEFEEEMKHKTERIKPRLLGCIWASNHEDIAGTQLMKLLESRQAVYCDGPIDALVLNAVSTPGSPSLQDDLSTASPIHSGMKKTKLPDEAIPDLIRLVHGNTNSCKFLVNEFAAYWKKHTEGQGGVPQSPSVILTNSSIADKIKEMAKKMICADEGAMNGRKCWYVSQDVRCSYGLLGLDTSNMSWTYTLTPRRIRESVDSDSSPMIGTKSTKVPLITKFTKTMTPEERLKQLQSLATTKVSSDNGSEFSPKTSKSLLITNFTKVLSQEERLKQLQSSNKDIKGNVPTLNANPIPVKKRVPLLFSVPIGQSIPKSSSNSVDHLKSRSPSQAIENATPAGAESASEKPVVPVECIDLSD